MLEVHAKFSNNPSPSNLSHATRLVSGFGLDSIIWDEKIKERKKKLRVSKCEPYMLV